MLKNNKNEPKDFDSLAGSPRWMTKELLYNYDFNYNNASYIETLLNIDIYVSHFILKIIFFTLEF